MHEYAKTRSKAPPRRSIGRPARGALPFTDATTRPACLLRPLLELAFALFWNPTVRSTCAPGRNALPRRCSCAGAAASDTERLETAADGQHAVEAAAEITRRAMVVAIAADSRIVDDECESRRETKQTTRQREKRRARDETRSERASEKRKGFGLNDGLNVETEGFVPARGACSLGWERDGNIGGFRWGLVRGLFACICEFQM